MTLGNSPPPIINKEKPSKNQFEHRPTQTAWRASFKRFFSVPNIRYAVLWLAAGTLFAAVGKRAIRRREEELMIDDLENYLKNKRKKENGFE